ncbi:MAG: DUF885 domain-containing protein [Theionarchaea archaeon]|nr:DUF885 domain-containing protein [Theionarchaea archaeon]
MKTVPTHGNRKRLVSRTLVHKIAACISIFMLTGCIGQGTNPAPEQVSSVADIVAQLEGLPIDEFFEESFRYLQLRDPDTLIYNGLADEYGVEGYDQFTTLSDSYIRETQQLESGILGLLRGYDRSSLSSEQKLSYDIYEWYLDDLVRGHEFMYCGYPINSMGLWDTQYWLVYSLFDSLPMNSLQDARTYVTRLSQIDTWMEQLLEQLTLREQAGVIPPKFLVQRSISLVDICIQEREDGAFDAEATYLYTSFREKLEKINITDEQEYALLYTALAEIEQVFIPAFIELRDYLIYLESIASDAPGVGTLPGGEAYYTYILRYWTGTDYSPDQIHELGLVEVTRVQEEMRAVAVEMGYPEDVSMAELDQLFSTDTDYLHGEALKTEYERLIAEADEAMEDYFDLRPKAKVIVTYDPEAPPAYYQEPPRDGSGPGQMVANLANSAQFIFYNPTVLVHHETIPGHHVQIALASELDLPTSFRRDIIYNFYRQQVPFEAYTEGWALYAEGLASEMGLYRNDSLGNLGRLRLRLHRTARLVVDTGIHAKGWTVSQAIDYLEEATGSQYSQSRLAQIIAIPGQACGYNIGMLKILELRQRAMDQLGDKFDIKEFHNMILGHGPMPMQILEQVANDWIEANK